jgi:uncharacterized protein RhaS with RHS repeats
MIRSFMVDRLTRYAYDAIAGADGKPFDELISTTDALGHTTTYQYDELSRQISFVGWAMPTTSE